MKLKRNKTTGKVEVWEDGKKVDEIITMGDEINGEGIYQPQERKGRRTGKSD